MAMSGGAAGAPPHKRFLTPFLRRGISLLEVLISMFVLLFGLMGVAAIFPVGNHYAGRGEQYDRSAALTQQAFAEIQARGIMNPQNWVYAEPIPESEDLLADSNPLVMQPTSGPTPGTYNMTPASPTPLGPGHAFVLDPLGTAAAWRETLADTPDEKRLDQGSNMFPFALLTAGNPTGNPVEGNVSTNIDNPWEPSVGSLPVLPGQRWPLRRISLASPDPRTAGRPWAMPAGVAENVFRLPDDLANQEPEQDDRPGHLRWRSEIVGAPDDPSKFDPGNTTTIMYANDIPLSRASSGSYSWIATIVPTWQAGPSPWLPVSTGANALQPAHPQYRSMMCDVSVAVFYKRDATPNAENERSINAAMNVGGELVLYADNTPTGAEAVDNVVRDLRPGNWIAVAGVNPTNGLFLLKWYKLLSLDTETARPARINPSVGGPLVALRRATLEGPDWPPPPAGGLTVDNLRAIIMPGVIGVSTKTMRVAPVR